MLGVVVVVVLLVVLELRVILVVVVVLKLWVDFAYWWSCNGKGLRLQPAQQACLGISRVKQICLQHERKQDH